MNLTDQTMQQDIAAGERWLAAYETQSPSAESVARVKQAVREELARGLPGTARAGWAAWQGALAAAAAIVLCVTVGWYSTATSRQRPRPVAMDDVDLAWPSETEQEVVRLAYLDDALTDLESWSSDESWELDGALLYETLEEVLEDQADAEPQDPETSMGSRYHQDPNEGVA